MTQLSHTALVALPLSQAQKERFLTAAPQVAFIFKDPEEVTRKDLEGQEILIGRIPASLCPYASRARWFQAQAAGPDAYRKPGVLPEGVVLTSAVGAYGQAVSEHLLAMTLCLMKRLHTYRDAQHAHRWESQGQVTSLRGATVLVAGLGDIGDSYARLCYALGARVWGIRRSRVDVPDHLAGIFSPDHLDRLLPQADIVCLCLPDSPQTRKMFDRARLEKMKPGAYLLNGGRGTVLDTDALLPLLESGRLGGVGLDVTDPEPLPVDHPLWDAPGALITPHISGLFHLPQTLDHLIDLSLENLDRYLSGKPLKNVVTRQTGSASRKPWAELQPRASSVFYLLVRLSPEPPPEKPAQLLLGGEDVPGEILPGGVYRRPSVACVKPMVYKDRSPLGLIRMAEGRPTSLMVLSSCFSSWGSRADSPPRV